MVDCLLCRKCINRNEGYRLLILSPDGENLTDRQICPVCVGKVLDFRVTLLSDGVVTVDKIRKKERQRIPLTAIWEEDKDGVSETSPNS